MSRLWQVMESADRDALVSLLETVIGAYLNQLADPGEVDSQDLAENVVIQLERDGHRDH
jgi:hypothetical protein